MRTVRQKPAGLLTALSLRIWPLLPPSGVLTTIGTLNILAPTQLRLGPVLAAAPALAAATCAMAGTVVIGSMALLLAVLAAVVRQHLWDLPFQVTLASVLTVWMASLLACWRGQRHRAAFVRMRSVAEAAQQVVLRPIPGRLGPVDLSGVYNAAQADARIGGDFYECLETPHGVRMVIGDVRGKGLPAVEVSAALLGTFREAAYTETELPAVARRLEDSVQRLAGQMAELSEECFATALFVEIRDGTDIHIVHCGHPAPIVIRKGEVCVLEPATPGLPLGLSELCALPTSTQTVRFRPKDRLLLFTDGVTECRDSTGLFYPLAQRLEGWTGLPRPDLVQVVHDDLLRHCGGKSDDDMALLVVERRQ
ncbi:PP2C family protein-serine/threonine phosphatase [Streptomyces puniciscabiei]